MKLLIEYIKLGLVVFLGLLLLAGAVWHGYHKYRATMYLSEQYGKGDSK